MDQSKLTAPSVLLKPPEAGENHALLLLHGFTGAPGTVRYVGEAAARAGYTVYMPALPGHATTVEDMAKTGWRDWLDCARESCAYLRERFARVTVGGLSMGGLLAILLAAQYPVDSLVCISAALKTHAPFLWAMKPVSLILPTHTWPVEEPDPSYDKLTEYDDTYDAMPTKCLYDLWKLGKMARDSLFSVVAPTLIIQPLLDEQVKPVSARIIYEGISAKDKKLLWLHNSLHVCTLGPERDLVCAAILEHLRRTDDTKPLAI